MRIISGKYGGRRIHPPTNMPYTRPTTDIAKEGLFNILHTRVSIEDANTLDLFGGTGCISYELASRGASNLTIVEKEYNGKLQRLTPPIILDGSRMLDDGSYALLDQSVGIGNGSKAVVKCECYTHRVPNSENKAKAIRLYTVRIDELVPYTIKRDFNEEELRAVKGLEPKEEGEPLL